MTLLNFISEVEREVTIPVVTIPLPTVEPLLEQKEKRLQMVLNLQCRVQLAVTYFFGYFITGPQPLTSR